MAREKSIDGVEVADQSSNNASADGILSDEQELPTDEERATLRLVSAKVPWAAYAIAIIEFGEATFEILLRTVS